MTFWNLRTSPQRVRRPDRHRPEPRPLISPSTPGVLLFISRAVRHLPRFYDVLFAFDTRNTIQSSTGCLPQSQEIFWFTKHGSGPGPGNRRSRHATNPPTIAPAGQHLDHPGASAEGHPSTPRPDDVQRALHQDARETTGLKCAPETGPSSAISMPRPKTVASGYTPTSRESSVAWMPEPTTTAAGRAVTAATERLKEAGPATFEENDTACCHAPQDKVRVHGPARSHGRCTWPRPTSGTLGKSGTPTSRTAYRRPSQTIADRPSAAGSKAGRTDVRSSVWWRLVWAVGCAHPTGP